MPATRSRFHGHIAGLGSSSGTRVVVGHWPGTPFGPFSDVMVETAAGHRVLLAPDERVSDYVAATYSFDEVRLEPVTVRPGPDAWHVTAPSLDLRFVVGGRTPLGRALRLVPRRLATSPAWCAVTDPVARVVLDGVRTRGSAGGGRREWYGATSVRAVTSLAGRFDGTDLGSLAEVDPPCRFGFTSTPRRPSLTDVVTTVDVP
ncbi:hypothetical protein EKO23_17705 [Nocardioides guangzhouensis]|uniref:Uncharacterized protein n=1 Tax=Nocardioides guangzhouensis TaxID=2497878 RepID=A0A4Q4Z802_9ACTN|nr:hypothetical protein [Nocardioides guangzhouensis]RYP83913.1 hypothetical protein EKO23_17705 [Nocardioides guangzhouensis]